MSAKKTFIAIVLGIAAASAIAGTADATSSRDIVPNFEWNEVDPLSHAGDTCTVEYSFKTGGIFGLGEKTKYTYHEGFTVDRNGIPIKSSERFYHGSEGGWVNPDGTCGIVIDDVFYRGNIS